MNNLNKYVGFFRDKPSCFNRGLKKSGWRANISKQILQPVPLNLLLNIYLQVAADSWPGWEEPDPDQQYMAHTQLVHPFPQTNILYTNPKCQI